MFRVGHVYDKNSRSLKIRFTLKEHVHQFVIDFKSIKRSHTVDDPSPLITITQDRTSLETQEIRRVYADLDDGKSRGERDISIGYMNEEFHLLSQVSTIPLPISVQLTNFPMDQKTD